MATQAHGLRVVTEPQSVAALAVLAAGVLWLGVSWLEQSSVQQRASLRHQRLEAAARPWAPAMEQPRPRAFEVRGAGDLQLDGVYLEAGTGANGLPFYQHCRGRGRLLYWRPDFSDTGTWIVGPGDGRVSTLYYNATPDGQLQGGSWRPAHAPPPAPTVNEIPYEEARRLTQEVQRGR
jgi:hypothetical protein